MDLSFPRIERDATVIMLPPDLAVMLVGIAARQATSPTALLGARIAHSPMEEALLAPAHGAFNLATASALTRWKEE